MLLSMRRGCLPQTRFVSAQGSGFLLPHRRRQQDRPSGRAPKWWRYVRTLPRPGCDGRADRFAISTRVRAMVCPKSWDESSVSGRCHHSSRRSGATRHPQELLHCSWRSRLQRIRRRLASGASFRRSRKKMSRSQARARFGRRALELYSFYGLKREPVERAGFGTSSRCRLEGIEIGETIRRG